MIVGIGVDLVDIPRFERTVERTPRLLERLFSPTERTLNPRSLAARYAAKEALIKALGGSDGVHWTEIEVTPEASGRPWFTLTGSTAAVVADRGITTLHLSMSHDAGLATAYVVAEAASDAVPTAARAEAPSPPSPADSTLRPRDPEVDSARDGGLANVDGFGRAAPGAGEGGA
ncbi:holo-[acyl-carrier protein] synthase [Microbacterium ulmi]|uniref:Holo-[acyl-carrier-protein] synthase n=1 Tax=Microbacterium ulmi TaxID=179095 RepID=A0A7Y2Q0F0_9MICO|nr:holo-[acyl-carrier protein] synthase [Microbacterium ulmi]NNH04283.1 holo-ACP synthase [Microbacterium ulmi]